VFWAICPGWLSTAFLLISASWIAMDYRYDPPAPGLLFFLIIVIPVGENGIFMWFWFAFP
jgi:hypothetical protein